MHFLILNVGAPLCDSHYDANVSALAVCAQTAGACTGVGLILSVAVMALPLVAVLCLCSPLVVSSTFVPVRLNSSLVHYNGESGQEKTGSGKVGAWLGPSSPSSVVLSGRGATFYRYLDCSLFRVLAAPLDFTSHWAVCFHSAETGDSSRFPDEASIAVGDYNYFISNINLQDVPGKLLIGAA